jgi:hypothetical protein
MVMTPEIGYDGMAPFLDTGRPPSSALGRARAGVTVAIVVVPFAGLAAAVWLAWDHRRSARTRQNGPAHLN